MEQAFAAENIIFFSDNMEICFPAGSLKSQENACLLGLDYNDSLRAILKPLAIPDKQK